jgi:hypothetical protein
MRPVTALRRVVLARDGTRNHYPALISMQRAAVASGGVALHEGPPMVLSNRRAIDRRVFLQRLGLASTAVAVPTAVPLTDAHAYDPGSEETRGRYRETDHVKAFYRTNGYETLKK